MKHLIIILLLGISTFGIAQTTNAKRTITVYGSVVKPSDNAIYKTDITLTLDSGYYGDGPCQTLDELMEKYYAEIKKQNIDPSKFTRDDLAYVSTGYRKDGTVLRFETTDKNEIIKVTSVKMGQVFPSYVQMKSILSESEIKRLTKKALENARQNAEVLAEIAGEQIDQIHAISGSYDSASDAYWQSPTADSDYFRLTVVYTLKN